jgi:hypothetical protein
LISDFSEVTPKLCIINNVQRDECEIKRIDNVRWLASYQTLLTTYWLVGFSSSNRRSSKLSDTRHFSLERTKPELAQFLQLNTFTPPQLVLIDKKIRRIT